MAFLFLVLAGEQIAIFYFAQKGQWYATDNRCPHRQQMVLKTGACLSGEDYQIRTYPVKVSGEKVYVGFES